MVSFDAQARIFDRINTFEREHESFLQGPSLAAAFCLPDDFP